MKEERGEEDKNKQLLTVADILLGITKEEGEKIKQVIDQSDFDSVW